MTFRVAICGVILLSGFASPGHAAQSVSAPISIAASTPPSGAYYEQNGTNTCGTPGGGSSGTTGGGGNAIECKISFTAVPSGKTLVIEHVACNLRLYGDVLTSISLAQASGAVESRLVPLEPTLVSEAIYTYYALNDDVVYVTRGIPRLVVRSEANAELSMTCQISGHLK